MFQIPRCLSVHDKINIIIFSSRRRHHPKLLEGILLTTKIVRKWIHCYIPHCGLRDNHPSGRQWRMIAHVLSLNPDFRLHHLSSGHPTKTSFFLFPQYGSYRRAGNFREVYISCFSRLDQIRESLSREFVNITIQTHNTSTQIAKLKPRKCLFEREIAKFYSANIFRSTVVYC